MKPLDPLRAADAVWSRAVLSSEADARIRARLTKSKSRVLLLVPAAIAAGWWWFSIEPAPAPPAPSVALAPAERNCSLTEREGRTIAVGRCALELSELGVSIESSRPFEIARESDGVRLIEGEASFDVEPRGRRIRVYVGGGAIEIHGTRFVVVQRGGRGHVDLLEGAIRFIEPSGEEHEVIPGRRHHWDTAREPSAAPPAKVRRPRPPRAPEAVEPPRIDLDRELSEVRLLRADGRHRDASDRLRALLEVQIAASEREIVSFELGALLEGPLHDRRSACLHWQRHAEEHPGGTYAREVARALERCGR